MINTGRKYWTKPEHSLAKSGVQEEPEAKEACSVCRDNVAGQQLRKGLQHASKSPPRRCFYKAGDSRGGPPPAALTSHLACNYPQHYPQPDPSIVPPPPLHTTLPNSHQ
ncbi:hypothetical protein Pcinc_034713 [Petrolisthes cinctipes]|uniref:Uncharacterized protein n=1 Tax=Petrolisthes cinctipes TaxID=88211 RepID=A0AAE1BY22_PETCI|nr:hypothetical protein Pcinc_034713 [Petrolisthes cinctipes]